MGLMFSLQCCILMGRSFCFPELALRAWRAARASRGRVEKKLIVQSYY